MIVIMNPDSPPSQILTNKNILRFCLFLLFSLWGRYTDNTWGYYQLCFQESHLVGSRDCFRVLEDVVCENNSVRLFFAFVPPDLPDRGTVES